MELIEASVRLRLHRYAPDNKETSDPEKFDAVKKAFVTLSDRQSRAQYDHKYKQRRPSPGANDNNTVTYVATPETVRAEIRKRLGIVKVLYEQMLKDPHGASVSAIVLATAVGLRSEQLQFSLWFLKEKGLVSRTDHGDYCLTVDGAEWLERHSLPQRSGQPPQAKQTIGEAQAVNRAAPQIERRSMGSASEELRAEHEGLVAAVPPPHRLGGRELPVGTLTYLAQRWQHQHRGPQKGQRRRTQDLD